MTKKVIPALLAALLTTTMLCGCSGQSVELNIPPANSGAAPGKNLAWWSRAAMDAFMRFSVWSGSRSGYITLFARDGIPVYGNAVGWKDIATGQPMTLGTPVRIASMTKPITAVAAMTLVEEGKLGLDDPVAKYLPAFAQLRVATSHKPNADGTFATEPAKTVLRIRHLLMFSSGMGPGDKAGTPLEIYWDEQGIYSQTSGTLSERVNTLAAFPLLEEPGTQWRYGFSADVLASVIETISGQTIGTFMQQRVLQPLGMVHTRYLPPPADREQLATVYTQDENGGLITAPLPYDTEWTPGGGGMVSTAGDYMRFALMLFNGGQYQDVRVLQQDTVDEMRQLHVADGVLDEEGIEGMGWGLGMAVVADADSTITPDRNGDFWWAGYYGTTFFISPESGLVGVIMTQNEPGEYSSRPIGVYIAQGLAFAGL